MDRLQGSENLRLKGRRGGSYGGNRGVSGDRTYKLGFGTTSEPGRYVKSLGEPRDGHADWRLPEISELQSILVGPGVTEVAAASPADPASGLNETEQATTCSAPLCIDPDFAAIGGPTASWFYWSASSRAINPRAAWSARFNNGKVDDTFAKTNNFFVRAVRAGSCSL